MTTRREVANAVRARKHDLARLGFQGAFPTFHRLSDHGVHLVEVSFNSDSSKVAIDVGGQPHCALDDNDSADSLSVSEVEFSERAAGWQSLESLDLDDFVGELLNVAETRDLDLEASMSPSVDRLRAREVPGSFAGDAARLAWLAAKFHAAKAQRDQATQYAQLGLELVGLGPAGASIRVALERMLGVANPHQR